MSLVILASKDSQAGYNSIGKVLQGDEMLINQVILILLQGIKFD